MLAADALVVSDTPSPGLLPPRMTLPTLVNPGTPTVDGSELKEVPATDQSPSQEVLKSADVQDMHAGPIPQGPVVLPSNVSSGSPQLCFQGLKEWLTLTSPLPMPFTPPWHVSCDCMWSETLIVLTPPPAWDEDSLRSSPVQLRKHGHPPKAKPAAGDLERVAWMMSCFLEFTTARKDKWTKKKRKGRGRPEKEETAVDTKGPFMLKGDMTFKDFLEAIASMANTDRGNLTLSSLNCHKLSLMNKESFELLCEHVESVVKRADHVVYLTMKKPKRRQDDGDEVHVLWLWLTTCLEGGQTSNISTEVSEEDGHGSKCKKLGLDDTLMPIIDELEDKYPVGLCKSHPKLCCFHHVKQDLHFELMAMRIKIWTHAIHQMTTDYNRILLRSNFFKKTQALLPPGRQAKPGMHAGTPYHLPIVPHGYCPPNQQANGSPVYHQHMGAPHHWGGTGTQDKYHSSLPVPFCEVEEFVTHMNLPQEAIGKLKKIGFRVGDQLETVQPTI
ncbi:hypothetical protein K439DRAFT_1613890 [Ramaria rubella]|nr:hypothetical protein K439DRAFT_1613890 [Ramaria rubella]